MKRAGIDIADNILRILIAGGGTGGHIYPALAIAEALEEQETRTVVEFAGTQDRMEWHVVPKSGFAIHPITAVGIQRKLTLKNLLIPFKLFKGYLECRRLIKGFDPHVVVGTGGYVSGPVLWTAARMDKPVLIQEQNAYAGVTNKLLAKRARRIHVAFEDARRYFPKDKCVLSGNPTRKNLQGLNKSASQRALGIPENRRVLFVFGGSLGSAAINATMQAEIDRLLEDESIEVIWQTGKLYFERISAQVQKHERLRLLEYVDRMDLMYGAADLVVSRAGAISCSELMVTGAPSILVPSPNVAEDHQTKNAQAMEEAGASVLLPEADMKELLLETIIKLLSDGSTLKTMQERALSMARPDAATSIAADVLVLAQRGGWGGLPESEPNRSETNQPQ